MSYIEEGRPSGFTSSQVSQEWIPIVQDSELANKIEKARLDVVNALGKKKKRAEMHEERPRPDPQNIECPVCSLSTGRRTVMTRVESNTLTPDDAIDTDTETWDLNDTHDVFYHCAQCNMRVYREDPAFEDYAETNPHDALTVVAINDLNAEDSKPVMVASTNKFKRQQKKRDYQGRLDRIMEKLTDIE